MLPRVREFYGLESLWEVTPPRAKKPAAKKAKAKSKPKARPRAKSRARTRKG
jgi:hypothetical protein